MAWGLAIGANIPALFFLAYLDFWTANWAKAFIAGLLVFFGFGGLGIGALVGLAIASFFGDSIARRFRSILQKIEEARGLCSKLPLFCLWPVADLSPERGDVRFREDPTKGMPAAEGGL